MVSRRFWGIMLLLAIQHLDPRTARPAQSPTPNPTSTGPATPAKARAEKLFPILEYRVEGNTLLSKIDIERAVMPFLGVGKSIKDVEAARQGLEKVYHTRG